MTNSMAVWFLSLNPFTEAISLRRIRQFSSLRHNGQAPLSRILKFNSIC